MSMFNADGSEAEMCGNGVRCVAKYVTTTASPGSRRLSVETGRGVLTLDLDVRNGKVSASPWTWGRRSSTPTDPDHAAGTASRKLTVLSEER